MSAQQYNISDLSPETVAYLMREGLIEVNGTTVPQNGQPQAQASESKPAANGKHRRQALPRESFGAYGSYLKGEAFDVLHPVIRRGARGKAGSLEVKAKLNMLVVTGKCKLSDTAYKALPTVMSRNGLAARSHKRGGKVVSRFYAMNLRKDGEPDRRTTAYFTDGGRIRVDHATREVALAPEKGQEFDPAQVAAIQEVVDSLS